MPESNPVALEDCHIRCQREHAGSLYLIQPPQRATDSRALLCVWWGVKGKGFLGGHDASKSCSASTKW